MGKPNPQNLKVPTSEQARINGAKGGKKKAENMAKRKSMREMLDYLLEKELTNKNGEKATTLEAMMTAMIKQGLNGNVKAVEFIRDTTGQKPTEKVDVDAKGINIVVGSDEDKELLEDI